MYAVISLSSRNAALKTMQLLKPTTVNPPSYPMPMPHMSELLTGILERQREALQVHPCLTKTIASLASCMVEVPRVVMISQIGMGDSTSRGLVKTLMVHVFLPGWTLTIRGR